MKTDKLMSRLNLVIGSLNVAFFLAAPSHPLLNLGIGIICILIGLFT